jgi:hypothetical protein
MWNPTAVKVKKMVRRKFYVHGSYTDGLDFETPIAASESLLRAAELAATDPFPDSEILRVVSRG